MVQNSVGKELVTSCNKCKLDLAHMIVSMNGASIDRVMCKTCKATHKYKDPALKVISRAGAPKKTRKRTVKKTCEQLLEEALTGNSASTQKYSIRTKFVAGDILDHPKFGLGVVEKIIDNNKVEVLFKTDYKVLIHNK